MTRPAWFAGYPPSQPRARCSVMSKEAAGSLAWRAVHVVSCLTQLAPIRDRRRAQQDKPCLIAPACDPARSDCAHPADEAVPWQERVDLKALTNMQARPVTPEQPLATGGRASVRVWVHVWNAQASRSVPCALVSGEGEGQRNPITPPPAPLAPPRPAQSVSLSLDRSRPTNCRRQPSRRTISFKRRRQLRAS